VIGIVEKVLIEMLFVIQNSAENNKSNERLE
jgi:hypothetical protein